MTADLISALNLPCKGPILAALVGAGGKTTTMLTLAQQYKALGLRVLVTTTTRIYVPDPSQRDRLLLGSQPLAAPPGQPGTVTVAGEAVESNGKLVALESAVVDELYRIGSYDVILVEADGSKGKPLKAPSAYEPVIPCRATHVIGIIGMDAYGCAADEVHIHRLEAFLKLTEAEAGQPIDNGMLLRLIGSTEGLFKNTPPGAQRLLLLNKCRTAEAAQAAARLVTDCLENAVGGVTTGVWQ